MSDSSTGLRRISAAAINTPGIDSTADSTIICRVSRPREQPSESRIAIS